MTTVRARLVPYPPLVAEAENLYSMQGILKLLLATRSLPANAVVVCPLLGLYSHERAGVLHRIEGHLDGLQH